MRSTAATGARCGSRTSSTIRQLSQPGGAGNVVAVGDLEGYVHFLSRETGAFVARYASGGGAVRAAPVAFARACIQTQDGTLVALAL